MFATALCASAQGTPAPSERPGAAAASVQASLARFSAAQASSADTLRYSVRAGETLIVALPPRAAGSEVRYEVEQAPALSWLVDRSFLWRTLAQERGILPVRFRRFGSSGGGDTLVLLVEITP